MAQTEEHYVLPNPTLSRKAKVLVVRAPYYKDVGDALLSGAKAAIEGYGCSCDCVDVPGALEIPTAIGLAAQSGKYDAFVALGCIIRGETTHYETVCNDSSRGLMLLGLEGLCIGNGILTVENKAQADVRADPDGQNKGGGAAEAALHLFSLKLQYEMPAGEGSFLPDSEHFQMAGKD